MAEMEISDRTEFDKAIEKGVSLVDFNAPWCAPCRAMEPVMQRLASAYSGRVKIAKVNIDENREIALSLGIQSIPTIIVFKEGKEKKRFIGIQSPDTLVDELEKLTE